MSTLTEHHLSDLNLGLSRHHKQDTGLKRRDFRDVYLKRNYTSKIIYGVILYENSYYTFYANKEDDYYKEMTKEVSS